MTHTKGPWHVGRIAKPVNPGIEPWSLTIFAAPEQQQKGIGLKGVSAVVCLVSPPDKETEEDLCNACLMASAPDLLEALQNFIDQVELVDPGVYSDAISQAKEAIRKATEASE